MVKRLTKEWINGKGNFDKQITSAKDNLEKSAEGLEASPSSIFLQEATHEKRIKIRDMFEKEKADINQRSKVQWRFSG